MKNLTQLKADYATLIAQYNAKTGTYSQRSELQYLFQAVQSFDADQEIKAHRYAKRLCEILADTRYTSYENLSRASKYLDVVSMSEVVYQEVRKTLKGTLSSDQWCTLF